MKPVIHSEKHIIQNTLSTVAAGALEVHTIAKAVDTVGASNTEVSVGASIKAIQVEDWVRTGDTSPGSFVYIIAKLPGGVSNPSTTNMANLNDWSNKNNVFYVTQGLSNDQDADAINISNTFMKIPKGKQRMALGDEWITCLFAQALDQIHCGKFIYKEYT